MLTTIHSIVRPHLVKTFLKPQIIRLFMSSFKHLLVGNIVYDIGVWHYLSFTQLLGIIWLLKILRVFVIFDKTDETGSRRFEQL